MDTMGKPAAKQGDSIVATDLHIVLVPAPSGNPVPTPITPFPFRGSLTGNLSPDVHIEGRPAARVGSTADNQPPHITPPPTAFQTPPDNHGSIAAGSGTVSINGKGAARAGDPAQTCSQDPTIPPSPGTLVPKGPPIGRVTAQSTVLIGD